MRSKVLQKILDETPKEVEDFVHLYADSIINNKTMVKEFESTQGKFAFVIKPTEDSWTWSWEQLVYIYYGLCQIIGSVKDLTEEDWSNVIEGDYNFDKGIDTDKNTGESNDYYYEWYEYFDYINQKYDTISATESGKSLMESLNIDTRENWLLIKYL